MSIYGGTSAGTVSRKADPRPINTRDFINEQVEELIMYLANNHYNQRISPKTFNPPTGKDFKSIVTFLFRLLDEGYEMAGRVEDEVPLVFKALRYPFGISKTGLTAVGSPHTWPALLAALSWLVELLQYDAEVRAAEEDMEGQDERMFFGYLKQSYAAFLGGDDDRASALDEEIAATFRAKHEEISGETDEILAESARIRHELEMLRAQESELPSLRGKRADLVSDKGKFEKLIEQLHEHCSALNAKREQRESEVASKEAEVEEAREKLEHVRRVVETQELSPEDVESMRAQAKRHRERADAVARQRDEARRELADTEAELGSMIESLEADIARYHDAATGLHLLAPDDENASGVDFELRMDSTKLDPQLGVSTVEGSSAGRRESLTSQLSKLTTADVLGTDVRSVIKPALRELKTLFHQQTMDCRGQETELRDAIEATHESLEESRGRFSEASKRLHSLTDNYKRERSAVERDLEKLVARTEEMEGRVETARVELREAEGKAAAMDEAAFRTVRDNASKRVETARRVAMESVAGLKADMVAVAEHVDRIRSVLQRAASEQDAFVNSSVADARSKADLLSKRCQQLIDE
jgi:kinetochore protein NDC80